MNAKEQFLISELWILSWNASVQRALRYIKGVLDTERSEFKRLIIEYCNENLLPKYYGEVNETEHLNNIKHLADYGSQINKKLKIVEGYNIGIAQKLLNLQLKYLWVAGMIPIPPHCPVDRIILSKTRLRNKLNWTQIADIDSYVGAIHAIKEAAGQMPLAEWELTEFSRRNT